MKWPVSLLAKTIQPFVKDYFACQTEIYSHGEFWHLGVND